MPTGVNAVNDGKKAFSICFIKNFVSNWELIPIG